MSESEKLEEREYAKWQRDISPQTRRVESSLIARPKSLEEAMILSEIMAKSELVPKEFYGKPANCMLAIGLGDSLGLNPFQSVQGIAVVNGRAMLFGDLAKGIVMAHPELEYLKERSADQALAQAEGLCEVKRVGQDVIRVKFSQVDAVKAGLWGGNVWGKYPGRMLQMRARLFAMRDAFPDIFKGIKFYEEYTGHEETIKANDMMPRAKDEPPAPAEENIWEKIRERIRARLNSWGIKAKQEILPQSVPATVIPQGQGGLRQQPMMPKSTNSQAPDTPSEVIRPAQLAELIKNAEAMNLSPAMVSEHIRNRYGIEHLSKLKLNDYAEMFDWVMGL